MFSIIKPAKLGWKQTFRIKSHSSVSLCHKPSLICYPHNSNFSQIMCVLENVWRVGDINQMRKL